MRLFYLHLRSRLTGWALGSLAAISAISWLWLRQSDEYGTIIALIIIPLMPAVVIGASTRSPFGDTELSISYPLPVLRFSHLAGLLLCGSLALALSASGWPGDSISWELLRNLAGYTGLAFLGARFLGSGICWVVPLGYGVITLILDPDSRWAWVKHLPADTWSMSVGLTLMVIGLVAVTLGSARPAVDDGV